MVHLFFYAKKDDTLRYQKRYLFFENAENTRKFGSFKFAATLKSVVENYKLRFSNIKILKRTSLSYIIRRKNIWE